MVKKAEFNQYLDSSGANRLLATAVVHLSKASASNTALQPAAFLRDFLAQDLSGLIASAELAPAAKAKFAGDVASRIDRMTDPLPLYATKCNPIPAHPVRTLGRVFAWVWSI